MWTPNFYRKKVNYLSIYLNYIIRIDWISIEGYYFNKTGKLVRIPAWIFNIPELVLNSHKSMWWLDLESLNKVKVK